MTSQGYPDNGEIHRRKAEGRAELANRTFGEKIAAIEALRARLAPMKAAREQNTAHAALAENVLDAASESSSRINLWMISDTELPGRPAV